MLPARPEGGMVGGVVVSSGLAVSFWMGLNEGGG